MKIALISDIHIDSHAPWSKDVWGAFLARVDKAHITSVIVGGDLFDSLDDAKSLRDWMAHSLRNSSVERVLWVAGNHDLTNPSTQYQDNALQDLAFGEKIDLLCTPALVKWESVEIFVYPFPLRKKGGEENPFLWEMAERIDPPQKRRIGVVHGALSSWLVDVQEERNEVIPKNFADMMRCERVFLGHIHQRKQEGVYQSLGSARVWRRGESGEHGYWIYDTDTGETVFQPLLEGRVYEERSFFVFYGQVEPHGEEDFSLHTQLCIVLYGVVQNDTQREEVKRYFIDRYGSRVAELCFDDERLFLSQEKTNHPLWRLFFSKWEKAFGQGSEEEKSSWLLAREIFVREFCQWVKV